MSLVAVCVNSANIMATGEPWELTLEPHLFEDLLYACTIAKYAFSTLHCPVTTCLDLYMAVWLLYCTGKGAKQVRTAKIQYGPRPYTYHKEYGCRHIWYSWQPYRRHRKTQMFPAKTMDRCRWTQIVRDNQRYLLERAIAGTWQLWIQFSSILCIHNQRNTSVPITTL